MCVVSQLMSCVCVSVVMTHLTTPPCYCVSLVTETLEEPTLWDTPSGMATPCSHLGSTSVSLCQLE